MSKMQNIIRKVDVVIPVYKPGEQLSELLNKLLTQTIKINRIILINTEKDYFDDKYLVNPIIEVVHVTKAEFDHAATRNMGIQMSDADMVLFMTMDAIPYDNNLVMYLLESFDRNGSKGEKVAVAYARQLPREDCRMAECYTRYFNYPDESKIKTLDDLQELGIKTYFCSDVCAMYDVKIYNKLGGFVSRAIFNEDMLYAAKAINNGYAVAYSNSARVIHSHNYTLKEQFSRNFDLAVSQAEHPEVFADIKSEREGIKLVKNTAGYLCRNGHWYEVPYLFFTSAAKYLGYKKGLKFKKLSTKKILKYTMNKNYWKV